jgi:hypothetical protein
VPFMICSLLKFPHALAAPIDNTNVPVAATSQAPASNSPAGFMFTTGDHVSSSILCETKGDTSQLEAIPPGKVFGCIASLFSNPVV